MKTMDQHAIDKSTWGDGPWMTEPDRADWRHAGLPCLALRGPVGSWCGYVAVPPGHRFHGLSYSQCSQRPPCDEEYCAHAPESLVSVHGGLTYANRCEGQICHVPQPGESDEVWWFGCDFAHAFDFRPGLHAGLRKRDWPFDRESYDHARALLAKPLRADVYRTLDYVQAEVNGLAEQLAALAARG